MTLLTAEILALIGSERVYVAPEEFGGAAGRYFGIAVGDLNPLYFDDEYSRAQGLPGVTLPLTLVCETNQYAGLPLADSGYAGHEWDIEIPGARKVRGGNWYTFHRRVRPQDRITAKWRIADIEEKTTSQGLLMLVITSTAEYSNQHAEVLAENKETIIFVEMGARK